MPKISAIRAETVEIRFTKPFPPIQVEMGSNLMDSLLAAGRTVASSCGGEGVCGKCKVRVIEGVQNLSPIGSAERILAERVKLERTQRVSCQVLVLGNVTIDTTYW